jgi:hypothetical protein
MPPVSGAVPAYQFMAFSAPPPSSHRAPADARGAGRAAPFIAMAELYDRIDRYLELLS